MKKLILASVLLSSLSVATAATYTIDSHHTNARFSTLHNNTSSNVGGFFMLEGTVEFDPAKKTGSVDVIIPISKLNSGNPDFDNHLKTPDFFNIEKFPQMRFKSDKFVFDGEKVSEVHGDLTMLGQTKHIVLKAKNFNCYQNKMVKKEACGGDFATQIKPTDWGFRAPADAKIKIQIEAFKQ